MERPAPGFRYHPSGTPHGIGHYGYSYSSGVNNINGLDLSFGSEDLYPCSSGTRAGGIQLRCLSE